MSKTLETMTPELRSFVEEWKAKPGNLIMVLHRVQQTYGYIPREIAIEIIRNNAQDRVLIGLDYFDASINRVGAWAVGARNMQKA